MEKTILTTYKCKHINWRNSKCDYKTTSETESLDHLHKHEEDQKEETKRRKIIAWLEVICDYRFTKIPRGRYIAITRSNTVHIYARIGGGNQEEYQKDYDKIQNHPNCLVFVDDGDTYIDAWFSIPKEHMPYIEEMRKIMGVDEDGELYLGDL